MRAGMGFFGDASRRSSRNAGPLAPRVGSSYTLAAVLVVLLVILAALQHHWIEGVSRAERERMRARLEASAAGLAEDVDREIVRLFHAFRPEAGIPRDARAEHYSRRYEWWAALADARLVGDVLIAERDEALEWRLLRLVPEERRLAPAGWTPDLAGLRAGLEEGAHRPRGPGPGPMMPRLAAEVPALVLPLAFVAPSRRARHAEHERPGVLVIRLDAAFLRDDLLPALVERHFGARGELDYEVAIVRPGDPPEVMFQSGAAPLGDHLRKADVSVGLLGVSPPDPRGWPDRPGFRRRERRGPHGPPVEGAWRLLASHREGSLEAAVARVRWHNRGVGLGILVLLGASVVFTVVSSQRAQRLARQQMDFVAAVSHEMRTPLAAVRSAGQNLADGVVSEPAQVRRYGELVEGEGRRLSGMVEEALELAGMQSAERTYRRQAVALADVVEDAIEDCRFALEERGVVVERDLADGLPPVLGDPEALRTVVRNLVDNAAKYGEPERWVGVAARVARGSSEVVLTVSDRGPGIAPADRPRVFEPFYRGREAASRRVPGSGLGLAVVRRLVDAQGGRVHLDGEGPGTRIAVHLPAAPPGAA